MNNTSKYLLIAGIVSLVVTLSVFFLLIPFPLWTVTLCLPAIITTILAEAVLFGGLALIEKLLQNRDDAFSRSGCTMVVTAGAIVAFIASMTFMGKPLIVAPLFSATMLIIFAVIGLLFALFYYLGKHIERNDSKTLDTLSLNNARIQQLQNAATRCTDPTAADRIEKLAERIRFSDTSIAMAEDGRIDDCIQAILNLCNNDSFSNQEIDSALKDLDICISQRNIGVKAQQRGGF